MYFDDKFRDNAANQPLLPFYHGFDVFGLRTALENRMLKPIPSSQYDGDLVFLSYGRPAFLPTKPYVIQHFPPTYLLIKSDAIQNVKYVLPFESGTFLTGRYDGYIHSNTPAGNFTMNPHPSSLGKLVDFFYGTNERYLGNQAKQEIPHEFFGSEIHTYHNLIKASSGRATFTAVTPEIAMDQGIPINRKTLQAVILPIEFALAPQIQEIVVNECGAQLVPYHPHILPPMQFLQEIVRLIMPRRESILKQDEINAELISHLAKHPNKLYDIDPRKYEMLVAELLRDMGYDVYLTPQTVDGGRDIIAASKSPSHGTIITLVECKRYSKDRPVGIDTIKQFLWTLREQDKANIGLIVTTSSFSETARKIESGNNWLLNLHDFYKLKEWLSNYGKWQKSSESGGLWLPKSPLDT